MKPTLCLDFDGVLHAYSKGWQDGTIYDGPVPGAMDFLRDATDYFHVHIFSTRSSDRVRNEAMVLAIKHWLTAAFGVDEMVRLMMTPGLISFPTEKPAALVTLDDRAVTFTGTFPRPQELASFKAWWEAAQ